METIATQPHSRLGRYGRIVVVLCFSLTLFWSTSYAQEPLNRDSATLGTKNGSLLLKIDSARPLARAALDLQARYGYVITYEDPRYTNEDDLVDAAASVVKNYSEFRPGTAPKVIVPKPGQLTLTLPSSSTISSKELAEILRQLISLQKASAYGGHFRIEEDEDFFHIVPVEARDRNGNWNSQSPLLDTPISLPEEDRSDYKLYHDIASAVSSATHTSIFVVVNNGPIVTGPRVQPQHLRLGAINESARSVLTRALKLSRVKRTWVLMHTTEEGSNHFSLNVLDLPDPSQAAGP